MRGRLDAGRLAEADHVLEHLAEGARVLLEDAGPARQAGRDLDHVLVGDRADRADRLGDDQVRLQLGEQLLVELVERPPLGHRRLHRGVDLAPRSSPARDRGAGQVGEGFRLGRVVALVGDRDDVVPEAEGEEHLRRRGHQARNPHTEKAIFPTPNGRRRPPPKYRAT